MPFFLKPYFVYLRSVTHFDLWVVFVFRLLRKLFLVLNHLIAWEWLCAVEKFRELLNKLWFIMIMKLFLNIFIYYHRITAVVRDSDCNVCLLSQDYCWFFKINSFWAEKIYRFNVLIKNSNQFFDAISKLDAAIDND